VIFVGQARDFRAEHRPAVRLEGAKAVKVQDRRLMPRHGLLRVVGQINPLQGHSDPIGDVRKLLTARVVDQRPVSFNSFWISRNRFSDFASGIRLWLRHPAVSWP
jgi:hypothetical protein